MAESKGCSVVVVALVSALAFVVGAAAGVGVMWYTMPAASEGDEQPAPVVATTPVAPSGTPFGGVFPLEDTLRVDGPLSPDAVRDVVLDKRLELRPCYDEGLKRDPMLKGEMSLQFTVAGSNGAVTAAIERHTNFADKAVSKCILDKVKTWEFPPQKSRSVVRFEMLLIAMASDALR